jgi:hypothetical protein
MQLFKEACEKSIQEKVQGTVYVVQRLKKLVQSSNLKIVEEFLQYRQANSASSNEVELYTDAIELIIKKKEAEVAEAGIKLQTILEKVSNIESNRGDSEIVLQKLRGKVIVLCD